MEQQGEEMLGSEMLVSGRREATCEPAGVSWSRVRWRCRKETFFAWTRPSLSVASGIEDKEGQLAGACS